jgi:hypothetical protein
LGTSTNGRISLRRVSFAVKVRLWVKTSE